MFCDHPLFEAFIFVEPTIWPAEMAGVDAPVYKYVKRGIPTRRDHLPTKAEAKRYFEGRAPWSYWDSRIRDIYVVRSVPLRLFLYRRLLIGVRLESRSCQGWLDTQMRAET